YNLRWCASRRCTPRCPWIQLVPAAIDPRVASNHAKRDAARSRSERRRTQAVVIANGSVARNAHLFDRTIEAGRSADGLSREVITFDPENINYINWLYIYSAICNRGLAPMLSSRSVKNLATST